MVLVALARRARNNYMATPDTRDDTAWRGAVIYEANVRHWVEAPENIGKQIAIDLESRDFEVDPMAEAAAARLLERRPHATVYVRRITRGEGVALDGGGGDGPPSARPEMPSVEVARRGEALYRERIRCAMETPERIGQHVVIDVESGDFEASPDSATASLRLRERHPDGVFFGMRIGYETAYALGGTLRRTPPL
jgi:hypothetical protein